jgi:hypothetical protein
MSALQNNSTKQKLQESSIQYIIVPYDSEQEIFLTDRKYDKKKYAATLAQLGKISWLRKLGNFGQVVVYTIDGSKDHFWSTNSTSLITYTQNNPTQFIVTVSHAKKGDTIVFSDTFDAQWLASEISEEHSKVILTSIPYEKFFNSFVLPEDGNYRLNISYSPQKWVIIGNSISTGVLIMLLAILVIMAGKKLLKITR